MALKSFEIFYVFSAANRMTGALRTIGTNLTNLRNNVMGANAQLTALKANLILGGAAVLGFAAGVQVLRSLYDAGQKLREQMAQFRSLNLGATTDAKVIAAAWQTT